MSNKRDIGQPWKATLAIRNLKVAIYASIRIRSGFPWRKDGKQVLSRVYKRCVCRRGRWKDKLKRPYYARNTPKTIKL